MVENDAARRFLHHLEIRSAQAIFGDLPWVIFGVIRSSMSKADILVLTSVAFSGYSFGMKFSNFAALVNISDLGVDKIWT